MNPIPAGGRFPPHVNPPPPPQQEQGGQIKRISGIRDRGLNSKPSFSLIRFIASPFVSLKKGISRVIDRFFSSKAGEDSVRDTLLGKKIDFQLVTIYNSNKTHSIEAPQQFTKDVIRAGLALTVDGQKDEVSFLHQDKKADDFAYDAASKFHQALHNNKNAFHNACLLMNQANCAYLTTEIWQGLDKKYGQVLLQNYLPEYHLQIEGDYAQITIIVDYDVKYMGDSNRFNNKPIEKGGSIGYVSEKQVITISLEDLNVSWKHDIGDYGNKAAVARSLSVRDYTSSIELSVEGARRKINVKSEPLDPKIREMMSSKKPVIKNLTTEPTQPLSPTQSQASKQSPPLTPISPETYRESNGKTSSLQSALTDEAVGLLNALSRPLPDLPIKADSLKPLMPTRPPPPRPDKR